MIFQKKTQKQPGKTKISSTQIKYHYASNAAHFNNNLTATQSSIKYI